MFLGTPRPAPPHIFLHRLCSEAERYTADRHHEIHDQLLAEINDTIAKYTERYIKIEDTVRSEVEILYNTFIETNAEAREPSSGRRGSVMGKAKSRSASREGVQRNFSPPPRDHPSIQSVISGPTPTLKLKLSWNEDNSDLPEADDNDKTVPPPFAGSLLTSSLRHAPAPPVEPPRDRSERSVEQDLEEIRRGAKTKEQIEIGMSYAFSALDERMAKASFEDEPDTIQRAQASDLPHSVGKGLVQGTVGKGKKLVEKAVGKNLTFDIPENQEESSSEESDQSINKRIKEEAVVRVPSREYPKHPEESSSEESASPHKSDAPDDGEFQYCHFPILLFSNAVISQHCHSQYCRLPILSSPKNVIFQYYHLPILSFPNALETCAYR